jgi:hypothetical protein
LEYLGIFGNVFNDSEETIFKTLGENFPNLNSIFLEGNEPAIDSNADDYISKLQQVLP